MEGYTNVISSPEDFDDLNIERRQSRNESNIFEDRVKNSKNEEIFYEQLKVKLDDGSYGYVFSKSFNANNVARWHCHICDISVFTFDLDFHVGSKKHQDRYKFSMPPATLFPRVIKSADVLEDDMPKLAPGEPVPPGFEEKLFGVSQIQATLDNFKASPLIGLEYLVEIVDDSSPQCKYVCMLCDKRGDPQVILKHLTSSHHYSKYMGLYFPTVNRILAHEFPRTKIGRRSMAIALTRICGVIEQKFGRLKPISVDRFEFQNKRGMLFNKILSDSHIRETPDSAFIDVVKKIFSEEGEREKKYSDDMYLQNDLSEEASQCTTSTFIKGRITCDRSRLRTRDSESSFKDTDGQGEERKFPFGLSTAECGKLLEDKEGSCVSGISNDITKTRHGSVSPISTLSFSSDILSRSPSRSRSKSRSFSPTRSRFYRDRSGSPSKSLYSRLPRSRIDNRAYQPLRYNQRMSRSRSNSQPRSRSRRSRSNSISRLRRSNSKSESRIRRSNSKSESRTRRSNSKTISRSRRSNSKTRSRTRRSNSKSESRTRRSNSKTISRSRRSNSKTLSRSRRSNSQTISRSRRSNSKTRSRTIRSDSRSRRSNSKTKSRLRRSNSKTKSRSRRSSSKTKSKKSRSRSRSRRSRSRSKRSSSRSRLPGRRSNVWHKPRSQSKSPLRGHKRIELSNSPSNSKRSPQVVADADMCRERNKWDLFRREVGRMEDEAEKQLKFHEKNPEKHPLYPEEWKKFWNRRYKELQADGKDPENHDFKPEWIEFWTKRMHIIYEEELKVKKDEIRKKFKLPDDLPASGPLFHQGNKRKNRPDDDLPASEPSLSETTEKRNESERTKDGNRSKRPSSPWEESKAADRTFRSSPPQKRWNDQNLRGGYSSRGRGNPVKSIRMAQSDEPEMLSVLRLLTALENQLGSLGPKVNNLMAKAIALEKKSTKSSDVLLNDSENVVLFETVKEKLRGQLIAGIVGRNMVAATRACLDHLGSLLKKVDQRVASNEVSLAVSTPLTDSPLVVPGIGTMDKVAIAQQIASALVAQGKTDVTQEELEQLINAVVGMAHTSPHVQPVSAAQLITNLKETPSNNTNLVSLDVGKPTPLQQLLSVVNPTQPLSTTLVGNKNDNVSGLALLQSAYEEARISPASRNFMKDINSDIVSGKPAVKYTPRSEQDMSYLSEDELKSLLQNFKDLSPSEQQHLIAYLKKIEETEPARVEKLRKFVNIGSPVSSFPLPGKELTTKNSTSKSINRRLSPFSLRLGGSNPSVEEKVLVPESKEKKVGDSDPDSDDDYSFEDIYAAASKKVKEREKAKEEEEKLKAAKEKPNTENNATTFASKTSDDPAVILKETKAMIANLMGQLPGKFIQKQQTNVSSPKKDPILTNASSVGNQLNAPTIKESSANFASVPNILSFSTVPPPNISDASTVVGQQYPPQNPINSYQDSYSNQYSEQLYAPQDTQYDATYGNTYNSSYYNQYQQTYANQGISSQNMYTDHVTNMYPDRTHQTMYGQQDVYQVSSQSEPYRHQQQSYENQDPYQYASQRQTYY